ncbi:hypothetical protein LINPERPRIM_LOCUS35361, partial [Linum perenne]
SNLLADDVKIRPEDWEKEFIVDVHIFSRVEHPNLSTIFLILSQWQRSTIFFLPLNRLVL